MLTIIPDHDFVTGIARGFAATYNSQNIGFVDHFDNANAGSELSGELLSNLVSQLKYLESFLSADREVGLVLVEWNVQNLLLIFLHIDQN